MPGGLYYYATQKDEVSSLSHTKWDCKYHVVFTLKYRRKAIYAKLRADIGKYIRDQELEDQESDRRSLKECKDPFTGK